MSKTVSHPDAIIPQFRQLLQAESATAHAVNRQQPWERTAQNAVDDGFTEFDDELVRIIEDCVRRDA